MNKRYEIMASPRRVKLFEKIHKTGTIARNNPATSVACDTSLTALRRPFAVLPLPMDWEQLAELMHDEMNKLVHESICSLRGIAPSLKHLPRALAALESKSAAVIDSAVLDFASDHRWPELTSEEKTMLYYRLEFAYMTASLLSTAKTFSGQPLFSINTDGLTTADLIEWLLVAAWREEGIKLLHSTLVDVVSEDRAPHGPVFGHN